MTCPNCNCSNVSFQTVMEKKETSGGMIALYVILAITLLGLLILIPILLSNRARPVTYAVCQNCGFRWPVEYVYNGNVQFPKRDFVYCTHCGCKNPIENTICMKCNEFLEK